MKKLKTSLFLLIFTIISASSLMAQSLSDYIDVVYLTNGSMIKGIIIEQIPGKSLKIETSDGSQFVYQITEIEKLTRELKPSTTTTTTNNTNTTAPKVIKEPKPFYSKEKGCFGGVEFLIAGSGGIRVINGYKFGRLGYLGMAVGFEINKDNSNNWDSYMPYMSMWGDRSAYLTLNAVYGGDILKRRITPYYQVEFGYGFNLNSYEQVSSSYYDGMGNYYEYSYEQRSIGGPMGGFVFGVKFNTNKKVNFKLGLSSRSFSDINKRTDIPSGNKSTNFSMAHSVGLRFGIGF